MIDEGRNQVRVPLDHSSEAKINILAQEGGVISPKKGDEEVNGEIQIGNTNEECFESFQEPDYIIMSKETQCLIKPLADVIAIESNKKWEDVEENSKSLQGAKEDSGATWTQVGGKIITKSKKIKEVVSLKKNKDNSLLKTMSNNKGDIPSTPLGKGIKKGDFKSNKARECCLPVTPLGKGIKVGDVGLSPSSASRPSNVQRRIVETNRSITDGSQRIILDSIYFHKK